MCVCADVVWGGHGALCVCVCADVEGGQGALCVCVC